VNMLAAKCIYNNNDRININYMATVKHKSVEDYIAEYPFEIQNLLVRMRGIIKKAAPQAEEMISYNMPLYKWNGMLVSFAAWKKHIGLYPTPRVSGEMKKKLAPYEGAKATLRFPINKPLPTSLIAKVVKLRMKENVVRAKQKKVKKQRITN
jgi:uncharacterized protein YdhG (YjbR/CyaY superfamily)